MLDNKQKMQEELYTFPYHYIPSYEKGCFSLSRRLYYGYEYLSYIQYVLNKISILNFNSLLDVGCGDGRFLFEVYKLFPTRELAGIDISQRAIAYARAFNPSCKFIIGDIIDKPDFGVRGSGAFDVITLIDVLEHIPLDHAEAFLEACDCHLNRGGVMLITVPSTNLKTGPSHYRHFNLDSLVGFLAPLFRITEHTFINKTSLSVAILEKILSNRIFILNHKGIVNFIYRFYLKHMLLGNESNTKRIYISAVKKDDK